MPDEKILCIKRSNLPQAWLKDRISLPLNWSVFYVAASQLKPEFQLRNAVENDPDFKQLIPYILMLNRQGQLAFYQRSGSEKRLDGCFSVGIGGHVRDDDFDNSVFSWEAMQEKALRRELEEELPAFAAPASPDFLGLINEEITRVGHSHLGLVYLFRDIDSENLVVGEELRALQWMEPELLFSKSGHSFEIWSELAFELLKNQLFAG